MNIVVLDTEGCSTGAMHPWEPGYYMSCVGVVTENEGYRTEEFIWHDHCDERPTDGGIVRLQNIVDNADLIVMHNAKYDVCVLRSFGIKFNDTKLHCTMVTEYLLAGQDKKLSYSLNEIAKRYELGQKEDKVKSYWERGIETYDIPAWILKPYCLQDCHLTMDIFKNQIPLIKKRGLGRVVDLQNEFVYVLSDMESNGLLFDKDTATKIIETYQEKTTAKVVEILRGVPEGDKINLSSHQQLSAFLFGGLLKLKWYEWTVVEYKTKPYSDYYEKLHKKEVVFEGMGFTPNKKTKKADGYYGVDKDTIYDLTAHTKHQRQLKKNLIDYSKYAKIVSTLQGRKGDKGLMSKVMPDSCLHPALNQAITSTGRLTSSNPNGQNLFTTIKRCFTPRNDGIMQADLSQIEWRSAAWLSQDEVMMHEINSGIDQHVATLTQLMEMVYEGKDHPPSKEKRKHAKVFNFRMIFGGTEWGFYLDVNMPHFPLNKWAKTIKGFWAKYWGLDSMHKENIKFVYRNGFIEIPTGRWFKFHKQELKGGEYGYKVNQIKNKPIQGIAGGDILPLLGVIIRRGMRQMGLSSQLILTVHDSIVFDYVEAERDKLARLCYNVGNNLADYVSNYYGLKWNVKLEVEVEVGPNYGDLHYLPPEEVGL